MEKSTVEINGEIVEFFYTRKKIKNLILKVDKDNKIILSIPNRMSLNIAKVFIQKKYLWINKVITKHNNNSYIKESDSFNNDELLYLRGISYKIRIIPANENLISIQDTYIDLYIKERFIQNKEYIKKVYEKWLKDFAVNEFKKYVEKYCNIMSNYNIPYPNVEVRKMKSRWGECFPKHNKVVFNLSLIKTPINCIEYVVVHELSHFKYQNHSKDFYGFVELFIPNWKQNRKILNKEYSGMVT